MDSSLPRHLRALGARSLRLAAVLLSAWLLAAPVALATSPVLFHSPSDNGDNPGVPLNFGTTSQLNLWFAPGPSVSGGAEEVCLDGTGDEICGMTACLESTGGIVFAEFLDDPETGLVVRVSPTEFCFNYLVAGGVDSSPVRLGILTVHPGAGPGTVAVAASSEAVGAGLELVPVLDNGPLAVPEPGALWLWLAGGAYLVFLARGGKR